MAMVRNEMLRFVSRLRAFANLTSRRHPGADPLVLNLVRRMGSDPDRKTRLRLFRDLHRNLRELDGDRAFSTAREGSDGEAWLHLDQLRPRQRAALFLVLGADFTSVECATILDVSADEISADLSAAVFCLEHLLPLRALAETHGAGASEQVFA